MMEQRKSLCLQEKDSSETKGFGSRNSVLRIRFSIDDDIKKGSVDV